MTVYTPNATAILYSPGNWDVTSSRAATITPGAYLRFAVRGGTGITLTFDMEGVADPAPYIKYRVDQAGWVSAKLAGSIPLTMPSNSWDVHSVEVVVQSTSEHVPRWATQSAIVKLTGIDVPGATGLVGVSRRPLTGLVLGDSITEGYQSLKAVIDPVGSDATCTWSYLLSDTLGAEVGVIGYGGTGFGHAGVGGVPAWDGATHTHLWGGGPARDYSSMNLDFICINLGQNDAAETDENWKAAMVRLLTSLLSKTAATVKIFVVRSFFGVKAEAAQSAVNAMGSDRVQFVDTTGWYPSGPVHPFGYVSQTVVAPRLASAVRAGLAGYQPPPEPGVGTGLARYVFGADGAPIKL